MESKGARKGFKAILQVVADEFSWPHGSVEVSFPIRKSFFIGFEIELRLFLNRIESIEGQLYQIWAPSDRIYPDNFQ